MLRISCFYKVSSVNCCVDKRDSTSIRLQNIRRTASLINAIVISSSGGKDESLFSIEETLQGDHDFKTTSRRDLCNPKKIWGGSRGRHGLIPPRMKENARKTRHSWGKMTPLPLSVQIRADGILAGNKFLIPPVTSPGNGRRMIPNIMIPVRNYTVGKIVTPSTRTIQATPLMWYRGRWERSYRSTWIFVRDGGLYSRW